MEKQPAGVITRRTFVPPEMQKRYRELNCEIAAAYQDQKAVQAILMEILAEQGGLEVRIDRAVRKLDRLRQALRDLTARYRDRLRDLDAHDGKLTRLRAERRELANGRGNTV